MLSQFKKLFGYDHYENAAVLNLMNSAGYPADAVRFMAHMLAAQQIWLNRCHGLPAIAGALWPDWPATELTRINDKNHAAWKTYLDTLSDADLQNVVDYKNLRGESFSDRLIDVLSHVINHGTHHRAQTGQVLKQAGVQLPYMDYIFYVRENKAAQ